MAKVILKRDWFAPDGRLYRPTGKNVAQTIPDKTVFDDEGRLRLPSTAVLVDEPRPAKKVPDLEAAKARVSDTKNEAGPDDPSLPREVDQERAGRDATQARMEALGANDGDPVTTTTGDTEADRRAVERAERRANIQKQLEAERNAKGAKKTAKKKGS